MAKTTIKGQYSDEPEDDGKLRITTGKVLGVNPKICLGTIVVLVVLIIVIALYFGSRNNIHTEVAVSGDGAWHGTITDEDGARSVAGNGTVYFSVKGDHISASISMDSGTLLTVKITRDGMLMANGTTRDADMPVSLDWTSKA